MIYTLKSDKAPLHTKRRIWGNYTAGELYFTDLKQAYAFLFGHKFNSFRIYYRHNYNIYFTANNAWNTQDFKFCPADNKNLCVFKLEKLEKNGYHLQPPFIIAESPLKALRKRIGFCLNSRILAEAIEPEQGYCKFSVQYPASLEPDKIEHYYIQEIHSEGNSNAFVL